MKLSLPVVRGMRRKSQTKSRRASVNATTAHGDVVTGLIERDDALDSMLRKLVSSFMNDLHSHVLFEKLFSQLDGR